MTGKYTPRQHAITVNAVKLHEMMRLAHELTVADDEYEYGLDSQDRQALLDWLEACILQVGMVAKEALPEGEG